MGKTLSNTMSRGNLAILLYVVEHQLGIRKFDLFGLKLACTQQSLFMKKIILNVIVFLSIDPLLTGSPIA